MRNISVSSSYPPPGHPMTWSLGVKAPPAPPAKPGAFELFAQAIGSFIAAGIMLLVFVGLFLAGFALLGIGLRLALAIAR